MLSNRAHPVLYQPKSPFYAPHLIMDYLRTVERDNDLVDKSRNDLRAGSQQEACRQQRDLRTALP
jgi:hypothetical protein